MQRGWKKVYIFVSSTFTDMHGERDFLVKRVFPRLSDWCERRRLRLLDIDLRWGVSEQDATLNRNVVNVCMRRIDECRPFFLCFLGKRYGWVPRPEDVSPETLQTFPTLNSAIQQGVSVTELEVMHAVVSPFCSAIPQRAPVCGAAFFFLREDAALADLPYDPACLRRLYADESETDPVRRDFLLSRLSRLKGQIALAASPPPISYQAHWDATAVTPELELPLDCPSVLEANAQRWRSQWCEFAGVEIPVTAFAVPPSGRDRAIEFNRRLTQGRLVEFSRDGASLADTICDSLQRAIAAQHPEYVEDSPDDALQAELDQQEEFLFDCSQEFIARGSDFAGLDLYAAGNGPQPLVLTAAAGTGKSMLLAAWLDSRKAAETTFQGLTLHYRFIGVSRGSSTVFSLLSSLAAELARAGKNELPTPADPAALRAQLTAILEAAGKKGRTILVLDGLNQLESGLRDLDWLPRQLPPDVRLIVSLRSESPGCPELLRRWRESGRMQIEEVLPFTLPEHRRMLVNAFLAQHLKQLDERQVEALIAGQGAQNPLYLKVVLSELRVFGGFAGLWDRIRGAYGHTPESAFDSMLRRLEREGAFTPIAPAIAAPELFGLLAHARNGLSVDELGALLGAALDPPATLEQGRETALHYLRQTRSFLARREGRHDFFYESLLNAALAYSEQRRPAADWHRLLARHFRNSATDRGSWKLSARRALAELPYHLLRSGDLDGLSAVYSDTSYLDARCRSLSGDDGVGVANPGLLEFLNELHQALPLLTEHNPKTGEAVGSLLRLLSERNSLLSRFPQFAVQEIGNYLPRYLKSDAANAITAAARRTPAPLGLGRTIVPETSYGHCSNITALASAPSRQEFLSGAADGTLGYWCVSEPRPRWVIPAHEERVTSIVFSPDGSRALTAGCDGAILLWDLAVASRRLFRPLGLGALDSWVGGFLDAETAVAATFATVFTLDLAGGSILWRAFVDSKLLALAPDAGAIVHAHDSGKSPFAVRLLPVNGGPPSQIASLPRAASRLIFTPNSDAILVTDHQGYIFAFDRHGAALAESSVDSPVSSWCLMADGTVAAGDRRGGMHRISPPPSMNVRNYPPGNWNFQAASALAPLAGNQVLAGRDDGSIDLADLATGVSLQSWKAATNMAAAALRDHGSAAALAGTRLQGECILGRGPYRISAGAPAARPPAEPHSQFITGVAELGNARVLTVDRGGTAVLWHGNKPERVHHTGLDLTCCGTWAEAGLGIAGTSQDTVCLIGRGPQVRQLPFPKHFDPPGVSAIAAAGKPVQIVAALQNSEVASAGRREWRQKSCSGMGTAAAIDPLCLRAATGHAFGKIHLWDAETGNQLWEMALHTGPVYALAFGPDGLLYSTGADRHLFVIDPESQRIVAATQLHGSGLALLPDAGGVLSSVDSTGTLYLFAPDGVVPAEARTRGSGWLQFFGRFLRKEVT